LVPLSIFEAEALGALIRAFSESRRQQLAVRFHETLRSLAASGLIDRMVGEDWLAETGVSNQLALDYLYRRIPCPFLEDESCSIYPDRPLACREHMVTSPPIFCEDPAEMKSVPVRLPLRFLHVLVRMGADLEGDSRGWIPLVFLLAWMESGARPGQRVAGDGPQVLYEFVRRLEDGYIQA
jgi:hypothetical protein